MSQPRQSSFDSATGVELLAGTALLPVDRVPVRGARRGAAPYDQDAVTLAAEAAIALLGADPALPAPAALIFASVSGPYEEGGSAQLIAELAGLGEALFTAELTSTPRDGLAALRLAAGLVAAGGGPVLICASHVRRSGGEREAGDGAVALLVGDGDGVATLTSGPAHAEELRDRWRLPGDAGPREEPDLSFTDEFGASRVARLMARAALERVPAPVGGPPGDVTPPVLVAGPSVRSARRVEREFGGPGDPAVARTGVLGTAHPLLRLLLSLDAPSIVVSASGGLGESLLVTPGDGAADLAHAAATEVAGGRDRDAVPAAPTQAGFSPYSSAPRSWRERGQDLRLEGIVEGARVLYPPPAWARGERRALARRGRVLTATRDLLYPGADEVQMAVVALDGGGRFYGQVCAAQSVSIDEEVRLVPRRLHAGGGTVQYFWKVCPCR